ncbi:MAG: membrane dipeptidase [Alphaproteobacteria bacterium]|uniref:dipeptidase n=1 Tax=Hyphomonas sp. TaxID=87 RepID=UPI001DFECFF0|nr:membrane dipeptidase [Alphaproteobacteria bacterium]MBU2082465.1 membrane dipeptidase [Alphaproteobacteria bacterium]MBU2141476.1 membrane dipeptidase [Alphaproteobacteria bacterium]MBU2197894.1 membrane dipeptidase [Alphaproteobacteria bacterium]
MGKMTRRVLLAGGAAVIAAGTYGAYAWRKRPDAAPLGFDLTDEELARGVAFLKANPALDAHAHPGRTFLRDASGLSPMMKAYASKGAFERRTVNDMIEGGLAGASFAAVSDINVLSPTKTGIAESRPFEPGEAWESYKIQIANLKKLASDGLVTPFINPADMDAVRATGKPGAIWTVEGADFLEGSSDRLAEAKADGVQSITLMHYRANEISEPMTESEDDSALSPAGEAIVREMNRLGMLIDLAHMPENAARRALAITDKPVMFSHTHVKTPELNHPRFISADLAREVAATGGVVGAWPSGIGISDLAGYADRIFTLIDAVGIDHVCMGTDMDGNYKPVFDDYRRLPDLTGLLLKRGMGETEAAQFFGGNLLRVWGQSIAA